MPDQLTEVLPQPQRPSFLEQFFNLIRTREKSETEEAGIVEPSESPVQHQLDKLDVRETNTKAVSKQVEDFLEGIRSEVCVIIVGRNRHRRQAVEAVISNHSAVEDCEWEPDYGIERRPAAIINLASND